MIRLLAMLLLIGQLSAGEAARSVPLAIDRGLAWLRTQQQADGSVGDKHRTATTGLAALAHLAAGTTPDLPEHGSAVRRMLTYLVGRADGNGYMGADGRGMYGHAIACIALADAIGTTRDDDLDERMRSTLVRAMAVIVAAARVGKDDANRGGWRYNPDEATSDASVTGWQLVALHAARRLGLAVPDDVVNGALSYLRRLMSADGRIGYTNPNEDRPTLRGLALLTLAMTGGVRDPLRDKVLARMNDEPISWTGPWFFYRAYYDAVGLARSEPAAWPVHRERLYGLLIANQGADGSWPAPPGDNEREYGVAYSNAMALLALTVDRRLLPAHQP